MPKLSPDNHLSGSVMPAWLGYSPWQSPYDVLEAARNSVKGIERPPLDSLPADIGTEAENVILDHGMRMLGLDPDKIGTHSHTESKKHPLMELYYTDDGLYTLEEPIEFKTDPAKNIYVMTQSGSLFVDCPIILEAKFTTVHRRADDPPLYRGPIQLQAGMMCHGYGAGILFTCHQGREITAHIFRSHVETQTAIKRAVASFEKHMKDGTWPDPATPDEAVQRFSQVKEDEPPIELDPDLADSVKQYQAAVDAIKSAEETKAGEATRLMTALGNYSAGNVVDAKTGKQYQVKCPMRKYKGKPAENCPSCSHELKAATPEREIRQKTVTIKELNNGE